MRWTREEYINLMTFGDSRPMFVELFGPLIGLDSEWKQQGATQDEIDMVAFDFDYVDLVNIGANTGLLDGLEPCVLEETDKYIISRDVFGRTNKLVKGYATISLPLDFPVKTMDDWLKIKHKFEFEERRIDLEKARNAKKLQQGGALTTAHMAGCFDMVRELMGDENACVACYEEPELVHDINATMSKCAIDCIERLSDVISPDNLVVHEDMAGKSGPLYGPKQIKEFMLPYYKNVWQCAKEAGAQLFSQDSDGDMTITVELFAESGLNIMYPCEPASGMDCVALRKKMGNRMAFKGGIDKFALLGNKQKIRDELEYKLQPIMRKGMVFGLDHRIPNGVPIDNYRYYVQTTREILGLPQASGKGWKRMAF